MAHPEHYTAPLTKKAPLEVVSGPMFSGKTDELIRRAKRARFYQKRDPYVVKAIIDTRGGVVDQVRSHDGETFPCEPVDIGAGGVIYLRDKAIRQQEPVIFIEEVQFFDGTIIDAIEDMRNAGIHVTVAGLISDFAGRPFGPMPELLAKADSITFFNAICVMCGQPASRTQRMVIPDPSNPSFSRPAFANEPLIVIGDAIVNQTLSYYEARCCACHLVPEGASIVTQALSDEIVNGLDY